MTDSLTQGDLGVVDSNTSLGQRRVNGKGRLGHCGLRSSRGVQYFNDLSSGTFLTQRRCRHFRAVRPGALCASAPRAASVHRKRNGRDRRTCSMLLLLGWPLLSENRQQVVDVSGLRLAGLSRRGLSRRRVLRDPATRHVRRRPEGIAAPEQRASVHLVVRRYACTRQFPEARRSARWPAAIREARATARLCRTRPRRRRRRSSDRRVCEGVRRLAPREREATPETLLRGDRPPTEHAYIRAQWSESAGRAPTSSSRSSTASLSRRFASSRN